MKLDGTDRERGFIPRSEEDLQDEHDRAYAETVALENEAREFAIRDSEGNPITPTHSVNSPSPEVRLTANGALDAPPDIFTELGSQRYIKLPDRVPQFVSRIQAARIYDQMVVNDATVDVSLRIAKTPVLGAFFFMEAFDDSQQNLDIAEFVEDNFLKGTTQPFLVVLEEILRMFDYGFTLLEPVWETREWAPDRPNANRRKYTMLRKLGARHAPTISDIKYDDNGEVVSVVQRAVRADDTQESVTIPVDKLLPFSFNKTGGNIEGRALCPQTSIPTYEVSEPPSQTRSKQEALGAYREVSFSSPPLSEIRVGDVIFDKDGNPTTVVAVQSWEDRQVYELTFRDGTKIVADENHEWLGENGVKRITKTLYPGFKIVNVWKDDFHIVQHIAVLPDRQTTICLEVDSPSHTFLCTDKLIPTCNSILRTAYKHWFYKDNLYKIDAIQKERHAIGVARAKLNPGYTAQDVATAWKLVSNLRTNENAGIVQPPTVEVDFAKMEGHIVDVIQSIEHHEARIMLNVYAEFMLLGLQGAGGRSTAASQVDTYIKAYRYIADSICSVFQLGLIPKIVGYNFDTDQMPVMKVRGLGNMQEVQQWARQQIDAPLKRGGKQTPSVTAQLKDKQLQAQLDAPDPYNQPDEPPTNGNGNGNGASGGTSGPAKGNTPNRTRGGNQSKGVNPR